MPHNELAIGVLKNRLASEESNLRSNQHRLEDGERTIREREEIEKRVSERIAHYERCIEFERRQVGVQIALAEQNREIAIREIERSERDIRSIRLTLDLLISLA